MSVLGGSLDSLDFPNMSAWNEFMPFSRGHFHMHVTQNGGGKGGEEALSLWITWCCNQAAGLSSLRAESTSFPPAHTDISPSVFRPAAGWMCCWYNCPRVSFVFFTCVRGLDLLWPWLHLHLSPFGPLETQRQTMIGRNEARNQNSINPNQSEVPNTADGLRPPFIFLRDAEMWQQRINADADRGGVSTVSSPKSQQKPSQEHVAAWSRQQTESWE